MELVPADVRSFLTQMKQYGYEEVAISGGEPMLYSGLQELSYSCQNLPMKLSVITNGMFQKRITEFVKNFTPTAVSISIDGPSSLHDKLRGKVGAFAISMKTIDKLVNISIANDLSTKIGVSLAVTKEIIPQLPKLVTEISEYGVNHINLHPVSIVGRALSSEITSLSEKDLMRLYLIQQALNSEIKNTVVSTDVYLPTFHRSIAQKDDLINPIVVRENGSVLPFTFWCPDIFNLGNIRDQQVNPFMSAQLASVLNTAISKLNKKRAASIYGQIERELQIKEKF